MVTYELDQESIKYLNQHFPNLKVYNQDILNVKWKTLFNDNFSVTSNFPYNISSQILFKIYENRDRVEQMVECFRKKLLKEFVLVRELKNGILSVLIQAFYNVEYLLLLTKMLFPPPKVKSGVINIMRNNIKKLDCDEELLQGCKSTF